MAPSILTGHEPCRGSIFKSKGSMENKTQVLNDINTVVYSAFSTITPQDCDGWIADSGIYNI